MQDKENILPRYLNLDTAFDHLNKDESPFIKGLGVDMNANPELGNGTNNPTGEGQNVLVLTPTRSNKKIPSAVLPTGINKNNGKFESKTTQEFYYFNWNSLGNHGIYVLDGNTGLVSKIIEDPKLAFSDNPEHYISEHRVRIRVRYDEKKNIIEKHLTWTDGNVWQGWVNVIAAIATNGFDVSLYPYWQLQPPHFDREELFQYPMRPPMYQPVITKLPNTTADLGLINRVLDNAFQFCYQGIYTDGRQTTVSPYSLPSIVKTSDFLSNPDLLPKKVQLELYAGSCMYETINLYFRKTIYKKNELTSEILTWSDWYLYDTINKFSNCGVNSQDVIGNNYWLRKNQWDGFSYDAVKNTIKYIFDYSKTPQITPQDLFERVYNDIPQLSLSMTDLGDSIAFANNRENYNNLPCEITNKLSTEILTGSANQCTLPFRKIRMYVYVGRQRGNSQGDTDTPRIDNIWTSQLGYYNGDDKSVRFGGVYISTIPVGSQNINAAINVNESKYFDLDFADKENFRVYLKGTPYYADAKWFQVKKDNSISPLTGLIDASNTSDINFIKNALLDLSYFVGVFDLEVPAGRYIATIGRHNIESSGDYRNTSTYILGIADSKMASNSSYNANDGLPQQAVNITIRTVKPNAIVSNSKEMEIDCTGGDIDVWGNGKDLFYIFCPFNGRTIGKSRWTFIEGYFQEDKTNSIPVEQFPYSLSYSQSGTTGVVTDKNGFFWGYTWGKSSLNNEANIRFDAVVNCAVKSFGIPINNGNSDSGWRHDNFAYLSDYNAGQVGFANRIILKGKITDITGGIGYSNISVSIVDGITSNTNNKGEFTLIIHNGKTTARVSNIYINASGSFLITLSNCGVLPLYNYNDATVPCQIVSERRYADINQAITIQGGDYQSLKATGSYVNGIVLADLAGRESYTNKISEPIVQSFLQRNNTLPTYFGWNLSGLLGLNNTPTKDFKWIGFYTTLASNYKKYTQWVGDKIEFINENGIVTTTPSTASLVRITITSLLNANIQNNLNLLTNYQFTPNDRLRVLDDGDNGLYDTATYGEGIDVQILGSNYNEAAINANLIIPPANTVLNNTNVVGVNPTTLFVNYDSRFDKLKDKTGFWIELYTPTENNDKLPFFEIKWYPVVNGEIAEYVGGGVSAPVYNYPKSGILDYWDTYQIRRSINIPNVGNKFIQHIFESPNVTDMWGANLSSGGRANAINPYALQMWYRDILIRSDDFISNGILNGLGTFRTENKKDFKGYQRGGIVAISCQFSVIFFLCENDYFVTDFNYNYIYANAQGIQVANLDNNLGEPHQKVGSNFGLSYDNTRAVIIYDKIVSWYDKKNEGLIIASYGGNASDVSDLTDKEGRKYGVKSYFIKKSQFIGNWNATHGLDSLFDVIMGIDTVRKNILVTFRPRRKNTNIVNSYVNELRDIKLDYQETIVYNLLTERWTKFENFTPDGYGNVTGLKTGVEFLTFFAGIPYNQNNTDKKVTTIIIGECFCPEGYSKINNICTKNTVAGLIGDAGTLHPVGSVYFATYIRNIPLAIPKVNTYNVTYASSIVNSMLPTTVTSTIVSGVEQFDLPYSVIYHVGISLVINAGIYSYTAAYAIPFSQAGFDFYYSTDNGITYTLLTVVTNINPQLVSYMLPITNSYTPHVLLIKRKSDGFVDYGVYITTLFLYPSIIDVDTQPVTCNPDRVVVLDDGKVDFLKFYGKQTEPVFISVYNKKENDVKILQSMRQDTIGANMYVDMIYDSQKNSFSYIPTNLFTEKEKNSYGAVLRDMVSYLEPNEQEKFRSTLQQGKRMFGELFIVRFIGNYNTLGNYFQISEIGYLFTNSSPVKP